MTYIAVKPIEVNRCRGCIFNAKHCTRPLDVMKYQCCDNNGNHIYIFIILQELNKNIKVL